MRDDTDEGQCAFEGSLIFGEDGSATARYGHESAVRRLYEYEVSGVPPDRGRAGGQWRRWEPYTAKAPNGEIFTRRGWECILGRLLAYEQSKLTPEQWEQAARHQQVCGRTDTTG